MPKVQIKHKSSQDPQKCIEALKNYFESNPDLKKLDPKIQVQFAPGASNGKVNGSQFKADILVAKDGAGAIVDITIDLPLLLTPFKGKVEESLRKNLNKYLA